MMKKIPAALILFFFCLLSSLPVLAQTALTNLPNTDGTVRTVIRSGNYVYIGGSFTTVGAISRTGLARINVNTGDVDGWNPQVDGSVICMRFSADGSILYFGGIFTSVKGSARGSLAAVDTSSSATLQSWNPDAGAASSVSGMVISGSNTVYIHGVFSTVKDAGGNDVNRNGMAAIEADGDITAFDPNPSNASSLRSIAISSDGNFIFTGFGNATVNLGGANRQNFAALNAADGTVTSWNPAPDAGVFGIYVSGTTLFMAGSFQNVAGSARERLAKFTDVNSSPALDASFAPTSSSGPSSLVRDIFYDGTNAYISGEFKKYNGVVRHGFAKINGSTGALISGYGLGVSTLYNGTANAQSKLSGSTTHGTLFLYGFGTNSYSALGREARYYIGINFNATGPMAAQTEKTINGNATYTFNDEQTAIKMTITGHVSDGNITVNRFTDASPDYSNVSQSQRSIYRWLIFEDDNFDAAGVTLTFVLSDIPQNGITSASSVKVYYRLTPGEGNFTDAGTVTINSGELSVDASSAFQSFNATAVEFIFASNDNPLPVELVNFEAKARASAVELAWTTGYEIDNMGFDIERRHGNSGWQRIGFVQGHGTSPTGARYRYSDNDCAPGHYVYRLRQIDTDGKSSFSGEVNAVVEDVSGEFTLSAFPNPSPASVRIRFESPSEIALTAEIFNESGALVSVLSTGTTVNGIRELVWNGTSADGTPCPAGLYFCRAATATGITILPVSIVR